MKMFLIYNAPFTYFIVMKELYYYDECKFG